LSLRPRAHRHHASLHYRPSGRNPTTKGRRAQQLPASSTLQAMVEINGLMLTLFVSFACLGSVALMAIAMFAPVMGGGMDPKIWFGWHPVLMTLAFPCLMTMGRWSYLTGDDRPLASQRTLHGVLMGLGSLAMLLGYLAIFEAHLPQAKFFGYDFKNKVWAEYKRVIHVYLGYLLILVVLVQACMGAWKMRVLGTGRKVMTFHGSLGKAIVLLGCVNILIAIRFWFWSSGMKVVLYAATLLAGLFGTVWPRPAKSGGGEDSQLLPGQA